MTEDKPSETDLRAFRAELKLVLASKHFTRAPKLAHLLFYLCERFFAGEANQIKEYSIGVDVFYRGAQFDQDSDSIVRVEANRLRHQLAGYYADEGREHRLRISIPVGQYIPAFKLQAVAKQMPKFAGFRLPGRPVWWMVGVLALLFLSIGVSVALLRLHRAASSSSLSGLPEGTQIGPPAGDEIRLLAGSSRSFVDHAGKLWSVDTGFEGGMAVKTPEATIWRTQEQGFYRTSRQGQFRYRIALKKGIYELHLHFAETVYGLDSGGEGRRLFSVRANGKTLLDHFDLVADAGASRTADVKVFTDIAPGADGKLTLDFSAEAGQQATLSAIEILPGLYGRMRPVRLLTRQTPYYSNDSHWWSPDNYFEGGQMARDAAPAAGTDDPELYETERWGNFSYAVPAVPGKYTLVLHFAAWRDNGPQSEEDAHVRSARRFNVFCNGNALLKDFDLRKQARPGEALMRRFEHLEPNAQGKLLLNFVPVAGYATVAGIEVLPE
jgi:hypothetical protein